MKVYRVEIGKSVLADVDELKSFLRSVMSREGAHRYIDAMYGELMSLSVCADCFPLSRSATIRTVHPQARRMVSHNHKFVYVFYIEDDVVVIDRILKSKMITQ